MNPAEDPFLPLTRDILDRVCPPSRASAIPPFQPQRASIYWRRVSGGRALHAFAPGGQEPLCGVDPVRAHGGPVRWIDVAFGTWGYAQFPLRGAARARGPHRECQRLAERWAAAR